MSDLPPDAEALRKEILDGVSKISVPRNRTAAAQRYALVGALAANSEREQFQRAADAHDLSAAEWLSLNWLMARLVEMRPRAVGAAKSREDPRVERLRQEAREAFQALQLPKEWACASVTEQQAVDTLLRHAAFAAISAVDRPEPAPRRTRLKLFIWNHVFPTRLWLRLKNSRIKQWLVYG